MSAPSAADADRATSKAIHDLGSTWMLHPDTMARARDNGFDNPFAFYFAGRGGVLGDVDAEVVYSAFGWFCPSVVRPMWEAGVAVHGAREAAVRYFAACADWGRDHVAGVEGLERFADLAGRVVSAAESSGRPLFAGWKVQPQVADGPGRAIQLVHVMREWRGANHLVATTASGLSPLEAILGLDGDAQAKFFGWPEPFPPDQRRPEEAQAGGRGAHRRAVRAGVRGLDRTGTGGVHGCGGGFDRGGSRLTARHSSRARLAQSDRHSLECGIESSKLIRIGRDGPADRPDGCSPVDTLRPMP